MPNRFVPANQARREDGCLSHLIGLKIHLDVLCHDLANGSIHAQEQNKMACPDGFTPGLAGLLVTIRHNIRG
jgi:hypothetical protein